MIFVAALKSWNTGDSPPVVVGCWSVPASGMLASGFGMHAYRGAGESQACSVGLSSVTGFSGSYQSHIKHQQITSKSMRFVFPKARE